MRLSEGGSSVRGRTTFGAVAIRLQSVCSVVMGIILFLVDTSASMNQRTYLGTSYLDVAKVAIETFMKYRSRDPAGRGDRYMLVSFDEHPNAVKAGWKENHATFLTELKTLEATSVSTFGWALKQSFDLLNTHRLHTSIDHYGQGRNPFYLEPAVVIALTDGGKLSSPSTVDKELSVPLESTSEGYELTNKPFRWDQRFFTVLLHLPGMGEKSTTKDSDHLLAEASVSTMCESTGGKCYVVASQKSLVKCMESLTQKLHPGVVLNFHKIGGASSNGNNSDVTPMEIDDRESTPGPNAANGNDNGGDQDKDVSSTAWHVTKKMIFVKVNPKTSVPSGFWPIPESFWPNTNTTTLPPRDVHPMVLFDTVDSPPLLVENFPFDKYELEPSPLTQYILAKRNSNFCWQVFMKNSGKQDGITSPFGYLKASISLTHVTLFVMPYNYPKLLPLISELQKQRMKPSPKWRADFTDYTTSIPSYYAQPLRNAIQLIGGPSSVIPDSFDGQLSYSVTNYLRKLKKQAKIESERVQTAVAKNRANDAARKTNSIVDLGEGISIAIGSTQTAESVTSQSFKNPFDIARFGLLSQVSRMRLNFLHSTPTTPNFIEEVVRHQVPIGRMGNYQEHLKKMNPLRELDSGSVRTQLFGNPFKLERPADSKQKADEDIAAFADEHMVEMNRKPSAGSGRRRRLRSLSPTPPPRSPKPAPSSQPSTPTAPPQSQQPALSTVRGNPQSSDGDDSVSLSKDNNGIVRKSDSSAPETETTKLVQSHQSLSKPEVVNQPKVDSIDSVAVSESNSLSDKPLQSSAPEPFTSSSLPEDRNSTKSQLDKVHQLSRKRERTPSPTFSIPYPKRHAAADSLPLVVKSSRPPSGGSVSNRTGSNHTIKAPSPVPGIVSASKVLGEEIQKQQGQDNARLKMLIIREVRKPGKNFDMIFHHMEGVRGSVDARKAFVQEVVREAKKFKKNKLIIQLNDWGEKLSLTKAADHHENTSSGKSKLMGKK